MPEISRFFSIIIRMFAEPPGIHNTPHFHAYYQEFSAVIGINPVGLIAGYLPQRQLRLVEAWAELHQLELEYDWKALLEGKAAQPIKPLE
jgi:hypothetical protein